MIPKYRIWLRKYQNWIYTTLWFVPHKVFENKTQNDLSHHKKKNCLLVIYYLFHLSKSELHLLVGRLQCGSNHCKKSSAEILNIFWPTTYQICSDKEKNRLEQCTLLVVYLGFFSKKKIATYFNEAYPPLYPLANMQSYEQGRRNRWSKCFTGNQRIRGWIN